MARFAACLGLCFCLGLVAAPAAGARTQRVYIAAGDSVTNSGFPGIAWADFYYRYLQADTNGGATEQVRLSSNFVSGGDIDGVVKLIDAPSNVVAVTLTTGGSGALGGGGCWAAPACPFPGQFATVLSSINAALAGDPGPERLEVLAYYNPASGLGPPQETAYDQAGLGSDLKIDCAGTGALVGLNDDIACIGWQQGWIVVDAWPAFKAGGQSLVEGVHPSRTGHQLLATLFENACDLPAPGPGVADLDGFLAAMPPNGGPGCAAAAPRGDGQIAFARFGSSSGIYVLGADGSGLQQLLATGRDPAWAPGGRIAYDTLNTIFIANSSGKSSRRLVGGGARQPTWSPDGRRIVFARHGSLFSIDTSGHHLRRITRPPRLRKPRVRAEDSQPAWSPDGRLIAFVESRGGCDKSIWTVAPNGHGKRQLTHSRPVNSALSPDWSPDGRTIAYTFPVRVQHACQGAQRALWTMSKTGKGQHVLAAPAGLSARDPSWSPDGRLLAFSASPPGTSGLGLYVLDVASGAQRQVTASTDPGQPGDVTPAWRPLAP
jgi:TolB protein